MVPKHSGHQRLFGGNLRFSHPRFFGGSFSGNTILKKTKLSLLNLFNKIKRRQLEVKKEKYEEVQLKASLLARMAGLVATKAEMKRSKLEISFDQ